MGIGRFEAWARMGRIMTAETMFNAAATAVEERNWRERISRAPHGEPWHSSFHVSEFPAGDPRACPRQRLYDMMGFPLVEPASRMLAGTAIMGEAAEEWNADNLDYDGRILSAGAVEGKKVQITDHDHWLTGSPDLIVLPPGWNRPHLIETKTKDMDVVTAMKLVQRSYDAQHGRQTRAYMGVAHHATPILWPAVVICQKTWKIAEPGIENVFDAMVCPDHGIQSDSGCLMVLDLEPLRTGSLIYMARDRPNTTCEYVFEHDEAWFQSGLEKLSQWRTLFENDELPPQPFGGKEWSQLPCNWCKHKRETCKPDHKAGVTKLSESHGIKWAETVYGHYDVERIMARVIERWRGKSGIDIKPVEERANV